jgi:hypothetical protein
VFGAIDAWRFGCGKCIIWGAAPLVKAVILGEVEIFQDVFDCMVVDLSRANT